MRWWFLGVAGLFLSFIQHRSLFRDVFYVEMTIYCLLNSNHRLTGPVPGRASPAVRGVLIWDTPIDVPRLKQVNWLVNYVVWEIPLIWNLLYRIWEKLLVMSPDYSYLTTMTGVQTCERLSQDSTRRDLKSDENAMTNRLTDD